MAIQEQLAQGFEMMRKVAFGEPGVDGKVVEAEKKFHKDKGPSKLDDEQAKTLLTIDILRTFSTDKGLTGIKKALDTIESKFPVTSIGVAGQKEIDIVAGELERQLSKFQAEMGGDSRLFKEVGELVKAKKWGDASNLMREVIVDANSRNEISGSQNTRLNLAVVDLESNDINRIRTRITSLEAEQATRRESGTGEVAVQMGKAEELDVKATRRYVAILKNSTANPIDTDPHFQVNTATVTEAGIEHFMGSLDSLHPDITRADVVRLKRFEEETVSNWSDLGAGIDIEKWSRGDKDKQRYVSEASAVVNHILFLESGGGLTITPEERTYLEAVRRATSAVKRLWNEEGTHEGVAAEPTQKMTPEELKDFKRQVANVELLGSIGDGTKFGEWTKQQRRRNPRGGWDLDTDSVEGGFSFKNTIDDYERDGLLKREDGQIVWLKGPDSFFEVMSELARDVSAIVPEVNQIPFSRSPKAMLYQALMESSAHPSQRGELAWAKDAVFRLYTMGYVKEALWKKGGDVESFAGAALALLGQGEDDSVYSSLFRFHETVKERGLAGEIGEEIIKIDLRDMLDFSEYYSHLKKGKRSWLNAISAGELDSGGDASSKPQRMEYFYDYMNWALDKQKDMGEINATEHATRKAAIGATAQSPEHKALFDVYGQYYTNLIKVLQSIQLRYGQVAVNQVVDGDGFEFCSPPGGEAPYKYHKNTVWKFVARYVPTNKFAEFADGNVDMAMVSSIAYGKKETVPHFCLTHQDVGANPAADEYFFGKETNSENKKRWAEQFVAFWKPAMFDSDNNPLIKDKDGNDVFEYRDSDEIRMIEETIEKATEQLSTWEASKLEFMEHIDYTKLSKASGYNFDKIFRDKGYTDPRKKFQYVIEHYGYRYFEWNGFRSKRVGDFYGKYLPTNYAGVYTGAIQLGMNITNDEAGFETAKNIDAFSGSANFIEDIDLVREKVNKRHLLGVRKPKTKGGANWLGVNEKGEKARINLEGDFESSLKGLLPGALPRTSLAGYLLRHRDPDWMRPILWEQAYGRGQMKPEAFEKKMKDYKGEMYFGPKIGKSKLRLGHILPVFLVRGWFVDKMHLDIDDLWWITGKANREYWEELKKIFGIKT